MKESITLSFLTSLNKTVRLQIPSPKTPVDAQAVNQAMDAIVAADVFAYATGRIAKKVSATLNTSDTSAIALS
jgi:hypothetical protein